MKGAGLSRGFCHQVAFALQTVAFNYDHPGEIILSADIVYFVLGLFSCLEKGSGRACPHRWPGQLSGSPHNLSVFSAIPPFQKLKHLTNLPAGRIGLVFP